MPFLTHIAVRRRATNQWVLLEDLCYLGKNDLISVPAGFLTDFASVPQWVQSFIPRTGNSDEAAVVHDWHCVNLAAARHHHYTPVVNARDTDGMFRRMLKEAGASLVKRWLMWTGVRWGALANPARRPGWWRDAPAVLAISALVLAVVGGALYGIHEATSALLGLL